jgi:hypothetical protein
MNIARAKNQRPNYSALPPNWPISPKDENTMTTKELLEMRRLLAELEAKEDRLADVERENQQLRELVRQEHMAQASAGPGYSGEDTE